MVNYPNERDCEHGRQRGKCESCDLIQAEQRIAELDSKVGELSLLLNSAQSEIEGLRSDLEKANAFEKRVKQEAKSFCGVIESLGNCDWI